MLKCQNCGRVLKRPDRVYFLLEVPHRAITEIRSFLQLNSVYYCADCIQVMRTKALN